jgi:hypothetical protein
MEIASFRKENTLGNYKEEGRQAIEELNRPRFGAQPPGTPEGQ